MGDYDVICCMKTLITLQTIICFFINALSINSSGAQLRQGKLLLGFGISGNSSSSKSMNDQPNTWENKYRSANSSLFFDYFIQDDISIGLGAGVNLSNSISINTDAANLTSSHYYTYSTPAILNVNKYFTVIPKLYVYLGLTSSYAKSRTRHKITSDNFSNSPIQQVVSNYNGYIFTSGLKLGMQWFPKQRWCLNFGLSGIGWRQQKNRSTIDPQFINSSQDFSFRINDSLISIGLNFLLGKN